MQNRSIVKKLRGNFRRRTRDNVKAEAEAEINVITYADHEEHSRQHVVIRRIRDCIAAIPWIVDK